MRHWLKEMGTPSGIFFGLFGSSWSGSWEPWPGSMLQSLGIVLFIVIIVVALVLSWRSYVHVHSYQMVSLLLEKQNQDEQQKTVLPQIWHYSLWISHWDKRNLTLMVTKSGINTQFLLNLSCMRRWPERGIKLIKRGGHKTEVAL